MEKQDVIKVLLPAYSKKAEKMGYVAGDSPYPDSSPSAAFYKDGEYVFSLMPRGEIRYKADTAYYDEVMKLTDVLLEMKEAYGIFLNAEPLPIKDVSNFRLFSDYGNHLMAARMEPDSSLHFVTWLYDYDRKGVTLGHYYGDNYAGAKQDFAVRAGLISENKLFTEEELVVLHDACAFRGQNDEEISFDDEKKLQGVLDKIGDNIPHLLFDRSGQQEQEHDNGMEV